MDEETKRFYEKVCIEYCENGCVSEDLYKIFMKAHGKLKYRDEKQVNAFMRDFIKHYIQDHNLPWRDNRYLYGEAYELHIFTNIDELPKETALGDLRFKIIESEE